MLSALRTLGKQITGPSVASKYIARPRSLARSPSSLATSYRPRLVAWRAPFHLITYKRPFSTDTIPNDLEDSHSDTSAMLFDYGEDVDDDLKFTPGDIFRDASVEQEGSITSGVDAWVDSVKETPHNLAALHQLLLTYTQTNQWERIENTWTSCFDLNDSPPFEPDSNAYSFLIRSFGERFGKSTRAQAILEEMESKNVAPTAHDYAYLMLSNARDFQPFKVLEMFNKFAKLPCKASDMRTAMRAMQSPLRKASTFLDTFQPLIAEKSKAVQPTTENTKSQPSSFKALWDSVEMEMYGFALSKSLANHDMDSANIYAQKILPSTSKLFSSTIEHVTKWYIEKGQLEDARNFLNSSLLRLERGYTRHHNIVPARLAILMLRILMGPHHKSEGVVAALAQFYTILPSYKAHDALALTSFMMQALLKHRRNKEVFEVADHVERTLGSAAALTKIFNFRMAAHVQLGQSSEAVQILARMQADGVHKPDPSTSSLLVTMTAKLHGAQAARDLLESVLSTIGVPHQRAFLSVMRAFCKDNNVNEAMGVIKLMKHHGMRITWDHHEPVMELFHKKNLLGKQFALFNTLMKQLPDETPSPSMVAELIVACIRQGYLLVARKVQEDAERRGVPLTLALLTTLVDLAQLTKQRTQLQSYAEHALKMLHSHEIKPNVRVSFGNLALRALSYLGQFATVQSVFTEQMLNKKLPLNVVTLNTMMSAILRTGKPHTSSKDSQLLTELGFSKAKSFEMNQARQRAKRFFADREAKFGSVATWKANHNSTTAALLIKSMEPKEFELVRKKWLDIVEYARQKKALAAARNGALEAKEEEMVDTQVEELEQGVDQRMKVSLRSDGLSSVDPNVDSESSDLPTSVEAEGVDSSPLDDTMESSTYIKREQRVTMPKLSIQVATAVLEQCHPRLMAEAQFALDVISACEEFNLPRTDITWTTKALALTALGRIEDAIEVLNAMIADHFELTLDVYHCLLYIISRHPTKKHGLAIKLLDYMEKKQSKKSAKPTLATYNLLLLCVRPNSFAVHLNRLLEAGFQPDSDSLMSMVNNMIDFLQPLQAAVNDTFVAMDFMKEKHKVQPNMKLLTTLALFLDHRHLDKQAWTWHYFSRLSSWLSSASSTTILDKLFFKAVANLIEAKETKSALKKMERPGMSIGANSSWVIAIQTFTAHIAPKTSSTLMPRKIVLVTKQPTEKLSSQSPQPTTIISKPTERAPIPKLKRSVLSKSPFGKVPKL